MTSVDEVIMDIVGRDTANIQGLDVDDCDVSFAPRTMVSTTDILVYPQPSDVRAEQMSFQDSSQAGPSGLQRSNPGNLLLPSFFFKIISFLSFFLFPPFISFFLSA